MQVILQTVLLNINKEESGTYKEFTPLLLSLYLFTGIKITEVLACLHISKLVQFYL